MEIFNATNLGFIMMGFGKTIEISALAIVFSILVGTVLAMAKQYCMGKLKFVSVIVSGSAARRTFCGSSSSTSR